MNFSRTLSSRLTCALSRFVRPGATLSLLAAAAVSLPDNAPAQGLTLDTGFAAPLFTLGNVAPFRTLVLANGQYLVFSGATDPFIGFERYNGVRTGNLLRFNADGTLDTTFALDPALNSKSVVAVAVTPGGQYMISTLFVSNSYSTSQVYRLNANGSLDGTFNTGAGTATNTGSSGLIRALVVQGDGRILAGGTGVTQYNGAPASDLIRLNTDGSVDASFNVTLDFGASGSFAAITNGLTGINTDTGIQLQTDGKIVIGGGFTTVNGATRPDVARLNTDGTVDTTFVPGGFTIAANSTNTASDVVRSVAIQPDGKILVAGYLNRSSTSSAIQPVIRLNANGSRDTTFNGPTGNLGRGYVVRVTAGGAVLVGATNLLELNSDGTRNTTFTGNAPFFLGVYSIALLPGGQLLVLAGDQAGDPAIGLYDLVRLNADGTQDSAFNAGSFEADAPPYHLAVRPNGTILASGLFDTVAGQPRAGLALLNADGSLNPTTLPSLFADDFFDGSPDFFILPDGKILLFGNTVPDVDGNISFTYVRLNADLTVDNTYTADPQVTTFSGAVYQPDRGFLLGGSADSIYITATGGYGGDPSFFLQRIDLQGMLDPGFVPDIDTTTIFNGNGPGTLANSTIYTGADGALAVQPDGKILYKYFDNTEVYRLVRFNADGSLDSSFQVGNAPTTSPVTSGFTAPVNLGAGTEQAMAIGSSSPGITGAFLQPDGRILIYGDFATYNGQTANGFARLNADGTLDATFNAGAGPQGPNGAVGSNYAITNAQVLSNGQLLLVGSFQAFNGVPLPGVARLNADGSVDTTFSTSGIVSQQVSIGTAGFGSGSSSIAPAGNGTFFLTGNYTSTSGAGAGTFFRLFGGVSTTPNPVNPVIPTSLPSFFSGSMPLAGGFAYLVLPNGNVFGYYNAAAYPYLYHDDLGFEYVFDARDSAGGIYLYDFASGDFLYTSPGFPFPYLYDFTLGTFLYYFPDTTRPGHYTSNPRYFYNFATREIISR